MTNNKNNTIINIENKKGVIKIKQVKFIDLEYPTYYMGGILTDNGDVICCCCGGLFECGDKGETWDIVEEYDHWTDLSEKIIKKFSKNLDN